MAKFEVHLTTFAPVYKVVTIEAEDAAEAVALGESNGHCFGWVPWELDADGLHGLNGPINSTLAEDEGL